MKAIIYLLKRSAINWIKKLKEKPARLVVIVFVLLAFFTTIITPRSQVEETYANINILYLIFFLLSLLFLGIAVYSGLSKGTSFFTMSDVNFMFTSPISSNIILFYGVFKQLGRAFVVSIYMIYQISNIRSNFGLSYMQGLFIIIIYVGMIFLSQLATLGIYAFTSSNEGRKRGVKIISFALLVLFVAYLAFSIYSKGLSGIASPLVYSFPMAGWLLGMLVGLVNGNLLLLILSTLITLAFIAFVVFAMIKWQPDYYEDCLLTSENAFHAKQMMKGDRGAKFQIKKISKEKIVKSHDFKRGAGASSFFYKHVIEIRRRNKAFIFGLSSLAFLLLGIILAISVRYTNGGPLYIAFIVLIYLNIFLVGVSKVSQELSRQFVYMVPESPLKKLLYISLSTITRSFIDGILIFIPSVFIGKFNFLAALALALAYVSANFLIVSSNLLMYRIFGKFSASSIILLVYFAASVFLLGPGIFFGLVFFVFSKQAYLGFLAFSLVNTGVSFLVFYICRNIVHDVDFLA